MNTLDEAKRTWWKARARTPRITRSATWSISNCFWSITVEVERHLDETAAHALEADLHALGFVLNSAGRVPLTDDEFVHEVSGAGWSARYGTDMDLPDNLVCAADARLKRLADLLDAPDVETRS